MAERPVQVPLALLTERTERTAVCPLTLRDEDVGWTEPGRPSSEVQLVLLVEELTEPKQREVDQLTRPGDDVQDTGGGECRALDGGQG